MINYELHALFIFIRNGVSIKQFDSSGIPITRIESIAKGKFDIEKTGRADIFNDKFKDYYLQKDDILMSHINSLKHLGKVAIIDQINDEVIHGMNLLCLRPNKSIIPKYIYYYFKSNLFYKDIFRISKKSVNQASFSISDFKKIKISVPSLPIQKKIAETLDIASELIEKRKLQLVEMDNLIQSIFIEMFGDPVINNKNWDLVKLTDLGVIGRGVSKHRPRNDPKLLGGEYPLIQTGDVSNSGLFINSYSSTYSEFGRQQSKLWEEGTLCITIAANIAKTSILGFSACFPDSVVGLVVNEKTNSIFMHNWFKFFQKIIENNAPESAQKNINLRILSELEVVYPPVELQNEFASIVEEIEAQKKLMEESLIEMENNFNALMQKAFKGESFPE
ncbi:restriction endonuclease subunit S [Vagococcus fluvialis]|uniref:restriction endonuclease subunit S n=1 Tax=Vagococcus fluvialis TaxID=2738 RepID=UPI003D0E8474